MRNIILTVLSCFVIFTASGQTFDKEFQFDQNGIQGNDLLLSHDGGTYVLASNRLVLQNTVNSSQIGSSYLMRINNFGDSLWTKRFGNWPEQMMKLTSIQETFDSNLILFGSVHRDGNLAYPIIVKTDLFGDTIWTKTLNLDSLRTGMDYYPVTGVIDHQSNFLVASTGDIGRPYVVKTDETGEIIWKWFDEYDGGIVTSIINTEDNDLLISATNSIVKLNSNGEFLWRKEYIDYSVTDISLLSDGNLIVCGNITGNNSDGGALFMFVGKINEDGTNIWTTTYDNEEFRDFHYSVARSVKELETGGYIVGGYGMSQPNEWPFLLRLDEQGDSVWSRVYTNFDGYFNDVNITSNGILSTGNSRGGVFLLKTLFDGSMCPGTIYDTTVYYVSSEEYQNREEVVLLDEVVQLTSNVSGCDSNIIRYIKFEYNSNHYSDTTEVLISVEDTLNITLTISTGQSEIEDELRVWSDGSSIYFESTNQEGYAFELITTTGSKVLDVDDTNLSSSISLIGLSEGMYIAKFTSLSDSNVSITKKVVLR